MPCNCKTQRKISYIQAKYGEDGKTMTGKEEKFTLGYFFKLVGLYTVVIILLPFILPFVIISGLVGKGTINLGKLLKKR